MKCCRLTIFAALFFLMYAASTDAAPVDEVQFWAYDEPGAIGDGKVTLDLRNFDFSGSSVPATLQYSIDNNTDWLPVASKLDLSGELHQIYLRLFTGTGTSINSGALDFLGEDGDYYGGATVAWTGYPGITFAVAGADKLSPTKITGSAVPLPPALLLFGSGLAGLFFVAREKRTCS